MGAFLNLLPVIVLFVVVGVGAFVGYQIYLWTNQMADRGKQHMEKKNVSFSKGGLRVGVKTIDEEAYADKTQSYLVQAWNYSSFPAYKSRFWNKEEQAKAKAAPQTRSTDNSRPVSSASGSSMPRVGSQRTTGPSRFPQA